MRIAILLILGVGAAAAVVAGPFTGVFSDPIFAVKFAMMPGIAFVVGFLQFRSLVLAVAAAVAPLPGAGLAAYGLSLTTFPIGPGAASLYALGFTVALLAGRRFADRIADGDVADVAVGGALRGALPAAWPAAATTAAMWWLVLSNARNPVTAPAIVLAAASIASAVFAFLAVPLAGSFVAAGEDFIALTNRIGEGWARRLDLISQAPHAPWRLSASGIFLVFAVLACFGSAGATIAAAERVVLMRDLEWGLPLLAAGALCVTRDWRRALAVWLSVSGSLLLAAWGYVRLGATINPPVFVSAGVLTAICFAPIAATAAAAVRLPGQDGAAASQTGVAQGGPAAAASVATSLLLLALWYRDADGMRLGLFLAALFAGAGALVFQPAISGAVEGLLPRRRSLAERYRLK